MNRLCTKKKFANKISLRIMKYIHNICRFKIFQFFIENIKKIFMNFYTLIVLTVIYKNWKSFCELFPSFLRYKFKYGLISFPGKQVVCFELVTT